MEQGSELQPFEARDMRADKKSNSVLMISEAYWFIYMSVEHPSPFSWLLLMTLLFLIALRSKQDGRQPFYFPSNGHVFLSPDHRAH